MESVDLIAIIKELRARKERVERVIAEVEAIGRSGGSDVGQPRPPGRRGRKSMGDEERRQVAKRMRAYWAAKRNGRRPSPPPGED